MGLITIEQSHYSDLVDARDRYKESAEEAEAMLHSIDMTDLAPITSFGSGARWDPAHYCSESLHEHPTVPQFMGELKHRVKEAADEA